MKTLRFIGMAIVAIIMSVNFVACSDDDDDNPIVGTWRSEVDNYGYSDSYTFNADGSGIWQEFKDNDIKINWNDLVNGCIVFELYRL